MASRRPGAPANPPAPRSRSRPLGIAALASLFTLALGVRLVVLVQVRDAPFLRLPLGDAQVYAEWSAELASGDWLGSRTFYQAPLYPYLLVVVRWLGGDLATARLLQALFGALGCALLASATARLFRARTGIVAGVLGALYAPWVWSDGLIQKTSLAMVLAAWLFLGFARSVSMGAQEPEHEGRSPRSLGLVLGLSLGLLALVRENSLLLLPAWLLWCAWKRERRAAIAPSLLGLALVLGPVAWRNQALGGTPLPTASNAGVNFYLGNHRDADGLYTPLVRGRGHPSFEEADARRIAEAAEGRSLAPSEVSAHWFARGLSEVRAEPGSWLRLLARKARLLLHRREAMDAESFESWRATSPVLDALGVVFHAGLLLPLAVLGLLASRGRAGLGLLRSAGPLLLLGLLAFFVTARFRLAVVPFLLPFAAHGALRLADLVRGGTERSREARTLRVPLATALAVALLANLPLGPYHRGPEAGGPAFDPIATTDANLASAALRVGEPALARDLANAALEREPRSLAARLNLAAALEGLGERNRAIAALEEAIRAHPAEATSAHAELGRLRAEAGELEVALTHLDAALAAGDPDARTHYNRGLVLRHLGREADAEAAYREAIARDPDFVDAHHNLGFLLERQGRANEAATCYRRALALDPGFARSRQALDRVTGGSEGALEPAQ